MLGKTALITLMLLSVGFAGCIGAKSDEPVDQNSDVNNSGTIDPEDAKAPDGRGDISAFKESNKTVMTGTDGEHHEHDYWKGQTRMEVTHIDSGLIPFPLMPPNMPTGTAIADYDIPAEDGLIYEGTSQVELFLNHASTPAGTPHPNVHVNFAFLTAADEPGAFRDGGQLLVGVPFIIPIKAIEADMPHQEKSLWVFRIFSSEPTWFEFNITVTAVKGYDVVKWPPHPDLYADKNERIIYDGPVKIKNAGTIDGNLYGTDADWQNPERVISYGTDRVEIEVRDVTIKGQNGAPIPDPARYILEFHNASKPPLLGHGAQYGGRLEDTGTDGTTWKFVIPVEQYGMDSPYGQKSRWGFRFIPQYSTEVNGNEACVDNSFAQQILLGCQVFPYELDYTITIKAYGTSISDAVIEDSRA